MLPRLLSAGAVFPGGGAIFFWLDGFEFSDAFAARLVSRLLHRRFSGMNRGSDDEILDRRGNDLSGLLDGGEVIITENNRKPIFVMLFRLGGKIGIHEGGNGDLVFGRNRTC